MGSVSHPPTVEIIPSGCSEKIDHMIKGKDDIEGAEALRNLTRDEIINNSPYLLEFLQDINWPVSAVVGDVLSGFTNDIELDIINILMGNDEEWKYSITLMLLYYSKEKPSNKILLVLEDKIKNPSKSEKFTDFDVECQEVINKWRK